MSRIWATLNILTYAVEHIGGLHVFKLCTYINTYIHAHFIDPMPVFMVEYETHQKKYV